MKNEGKSVFWSYVIVGIALVGGIIMAGCISSPEEGSKQELMVGISTDVDNWYLDNFPYGDARFVWSQVYETLVRLDTDLKIQPGLAESWKTPDDGKTWIFHLRKGIKFHDGTPFNSTAVVFSYSNKSYGRKSSLRTLDYVEALDEYSVKFVLKRPMPLPFYLTHVAWPIMSPTCVDEKGEFIKPIGTGPFKFVNQIKDLEIVLVRNDDYWGEKPTLEKVIFKVIPEATTRVMALETKEVDMIIKVPEFEVPRLEREVDIRVYRKLTTFTDYLKFNCKREPFNDPDVRKAVAYALDAEKMVKTVLNDVGIAARGRPYSPIMLYSKPDLKLYECDTEKAKGLLLKSGWRDTDGDGVLDKDGKPLKVTLLVERGAWSPRHTPMSEAIQGALREIGMDVKILLLERGALLKVLREGKFDMRLYSGCYVWGPYPRHFFTHHSNATKGLCSSQYENTEYNKLVDLADMTVNPKDQEKLYYKLQEWVVREVPAFYLVHEEKIVAANSYVKGYNITAEDPWLNLDGVYLKGKK
ncbi:MAG: ABC transporter substrate-binding protein [Methanophagales archaeon]|nr:ABC transporter substrate-binding protein [Methanophagales archaeon]